MRRETWRHPPCGGGRRASQYTVLDSATPVAGATGAPRTSMGEGTKDIELEGDEHGSGLEQEQEPCVFAGAGSLRRDDDRRLPGDEADVAHGRTARRGRKVQRGERAQEHERAYGGGRCSDAMGAGALMSANGPRRGRWRGTRPAPR